MDVQTTNKVKQTAKWLLLALPLLGSSTAAFAVDWNGSQGNAWSEPLNWDGGSVPTNADTADFIGDPALFSQPINSGAYAVLGVDFSALTSSLSLGNTGDLNIGNLGVTNGSGFVQTISNNGNLVLEDGASIDADVVINNSASLLFEGSSDAASAMVVNNGSIDISASDNGVAIGELSGDGSISLGDRVLTVGGLGGDASIGGVISASSATAGLVKEGAGTVTLSANNTFTGTTTINNGSLVIGNNDLSGSLLGNIINNATLAFNRADRVDYTASLTGLGDLQQNGSGTLVLHGEQVAGTTTVNAGTLLVGGTSDDLLAHLTSTDVNIETGGTLGGFGRITANVNNNSGGTLSPGASVGTLTINGDYTQAADADYHVEFSSDPTASHDTTLITGVANLDGTLELDTSNGFIVGQNHEILRADGGVNGTFATVTDSSGRPFTFFNSLSDSVAYGTNSVVFTPSLNTDAFLNAAVTSNQRTMANYLLNNPVSGSLATLLAGVDSTAALQSTLNDLSGAVYANQQFQLAQVGRWFTDQLSDRTNFYPQCRGMTDAKSAAHWPNNCMATRHFWVAPYVSSATLDAGDVSGLDTSMGGLALGADFVSGSNAKLGLAMASTYFHSDITGDESGDDHGMLYQIGAYGSYHRDHWLLGAGVDLGITGDIDTTRNIDDVATNTVSVANGSYSATVFSQQAKASYDIMLHHRHVRPFVGMVNQQVNGDSFTESGSDTGLLNVQNEKYHSFKSQLGTSLEIPIKSMTFVSAIAWQHEFADTQGNVDLQLVSVGGDSQNISGTKVGRDSGLTKASLVLLHNHHMDLTLLYEGVFADSYSEHGGKLQLDVNLG